MNLITKNELDVAAPVQRTRLEIGKTYINRLGARFRVIDISADDQVLFEHLDAGCQRTLPRPWLERELRPAPGGMDQHTRDTLLALAAILGVLLLGVVWS